MPRINEAERRTKERVLSLLQDKTGLSAQFTGRMFFGTIGAI
jgi:hypothetical protein